MESLTREHLIQQARALAEKKGQNYVLRTDFMKETGISDWQVIKHFDSWTSFFEQAGLEPQVLQRLDDEGLMESAKEVFLSEGTIPTSQRFFKLAPHSRKSYQRRWGTWPGFLAAFREWVLEKDPSFPLIEELEPKQASHPNDSVAAVVTKRASGGWPSSGGRRYGAFLNFRGLLHAPINEQGVVLLFGMVAYELGYLVESVTTGFPDCEAKRRLKGATESWEKVRIEFEFQSRAFQDHGHDSSQCDLIVCWDHNWPECPIEVLELSSAILQLDENE